MKTYSREDGLTSLSGGKRVPKFSARVEAYGSVDELIAWIGLLRDLTENKERQRVLVYIQDQLMKCASALATEDDEGKFLPDHNCNSIIEDEIRQMEAKLPVQRSFVLPGGHILVSYCHIARCVCRRVERVVLLLKNIENVAEIIPKFLNRLSDYLFVLSRLISLEIDIQEIKWPL